MRTHAWSCVLPACLNGPVQASFVSRLRPKRVGTDDRAKLGAREIWRSDPGTTHELLARCRSRIPAVPPDPPLLHPLLDRITSARTFLRCALLCPSRRSRHRHLCVQGVAHNDGGSGAAPPPSNQRGGELKAVDPWDDSWKWLMLLVTVAPLVSGICHAIKDHRAKHSPQQLGAIR